MILIRRVLLPLISALVLVSASCASTGVDGDGLAVFPDDPVCGVLPAEALATMLPSGDYTHLATKGIPNIISYAAETVVAFGDCDVTHKAVDNHAAYGGFYLYAGVNADGGHLADDCRDPMPAELRTPRVGAVLDGGTCTGLDPQGSWYSAWVLFWGGVSWSPAKPVTNLVQVTISPRIGTDGTASAVAVVQMVLDFIDTCYAADHPEANGPASPGPRPPGCNLPADQPSDSPS